MNTSKMMKERLTAGIKYAEGMLKLYQDIPTGGFGEILIINDLTEGKEILGKVDKTPKALVERVIKKLEEIK